VPSMRWSDLRGAQKGAVAVSGVVQFGLLAAALLDIYRCPAMEVRGDKRLWAAVAFINFIGPISYILFGRRR
jgi:hypothetical protein